MRCLYMTNKLVKDVFVAIACAITAFVLYMIFFGTKDLNGNAIAGENPFEGVLWFAARKVETPIGAYYYNYCYLPTIYNNMSMDTELAKTTSTTIPSASTIDMFHTNTKLSDESYDIYNLGTSGTNGYYSTGWK